MTLELLKTAKGYKRIDECNPLNVFRYDYSHTTNRIICNGERVVADVYVAVSPKETLRRIVVGMVGAVVFYALIVLMIGLAPIEMM